MASHVHLHDSIYGYVPTEWVCGVFIGFFGLSTVIHTAQSIRFRMWWLLPTAVLTGISEVIGWAGRLWSSHSPGSLNPYLIQICCTILAPTFLMAANFIILGKLIKTLGPQFSRIGPNKYAVIFLSADLVALIVQAVGGATASIAVENDRDPDKGGNIMLAGIAFQMACIVIYTILATEFTLRLALSRPIPSRLPATHSFPSETKDEKPSSDNHTNRTIDTKTKLMLFGLSFSTLCIFIRSVYRTVELTNGFSGPIIHTQQLFNFLDGMMVLVAMLSMNVLHPGWLLQ